MSQTSEIEWTDATWNPVRGCVKVSPGCAHCFAETFAERWRGVPGHPYEQGFDLRLVPEKLLEPLHWKKPRRVFVNSMSDLFQDGVSDNFVRRVWQIMARTPRHTYQVLTKRAERMASLVPQFADEHTAQDGSGWPLRNVWLGVSVENQHFAEERIPLLLKTPAKVRFISAEPLLEQVDLTNFLWTIPGARLNGLHWIIVGGESGHGARPFDVSWARWLVAQGKSAGVPVFVKQLGARAYGPDVHSAILLNRKGGDMSEWPEDLRVRDFPATASPR